MPAAQSAVQDVDGGGGVLWVRTDPWESARQPVAQSQDRRVSATSQGRAADGSSQSPEHGNGSGAGIEVQQQRSSGTNMMRVATPASHPSRGGNGHRAAVFDNVE